MATVKPVIFPRITSEAARPAAPLRPAQPQAKPAVAPQRQVGTARSSVQPQAGPGKAASGPQAKREQTLAAAISVLQEKSAQLYHKSGGRAKTVAELGQIIDVKA